MSRDVTWPAETSVSPLTNWREADRLAALFRYGILDTPPEPDFENITRVASLVCKAPIAVVNLIADNRQWFKSEIGLGVRETPLDISICAKAILQPGMLVVPDTTKDSRFDCNPLVIGEPYLRFYAGARLDTPEGLPLGTVCVLDYQPRPNGVSDEQREILLALARQAMAHIELRRAVASRELLAQELSHRIKNVFAVVSGLAIASARGDSAAQNFSKAFQARIQTLAKAHEYVLPHKSDVESSNEHTVRGLLQTLLAPYREEGRPRIVIEGDDAHLGATAATALALIIHEQATNAVKYGALSNETGHLRILCKRTNDAFELRWDERGGPPISVAPNRRGFGMEMVARSASSQLGGSTEHEWNEAGLTTRLSVPLINLAR